VLQWLLKSNKLRTFDIELHSYFTLLKLNTNMMLIK